MQRSKGAVRSRAKSGYASIHVNVVKITESCEDERNWKDEESAQKIKLKVCGIDQYVGPGPERSCKSCGPHKTGPKDWRGRSKQLERSEGNAQLGDQMCGKAYCDKGMVWDGSTCKECDKKGKKEQKLFGRKIVK